MLSISNFELQPKHTCAQRTCEALDINQSECEPVFVNNPFPHPESRDCVHSYFSINPPNNTGQRILILNLYSIFF